MPVRHEARGRRPAARGVRRLAMLAAIVVLAGPSCGRRSVPGLARSGGWIELRTAHFTVITDAGSRVGWDVAHELERFTQALGQLKPGLRAVSPLPTTVYVFRDQGELERYRPARAEKPIAFFGSTEDRSLLVLSGSPEGAGRSEAVFHEFLHCYLHGNFPSLPMWLDEGLAVYYSTCRVAPTWAEFGKPQVDVANRMRGRQPLSLEMMFATDTAAPAYRRDNALRDHFYAQSYVLTHWLQSPSGGRVARFDQFLARLHHGAAPITAFREVFPPTEWEAMVSGLDEYRRRMSLEPTRRVELPPPSGADHRGERALSRPEALTALGELQLGLDADHRAEAAEHFKAALELEPGFAPARVSLGLTADLDGRATEAERHYAAALAAAPNDARIWDVAGRGALRRLTKLMEAGTPREAIETIGHLARDRYRNSVRIAPGGLEALGGYGQTFAILGDSPDTAAARGLGRAVEALPGRTDLAAALSVLKARQGRTGEAEAPPSRRVAPASSHGQLENVRSAVRDADPDRAMDRARQGKKAEAEPLLARPAETSERAPQRLAKLREEGPRYAMTTEFNEAVRLVNADRLEEARARFVEVVDRTALPELRQQAEGNIRRLDAEVRLRRAADLLNGNRLAEAETTLAGPGAQWPDDDSRARAARVLAGVRGRREIERALALLKAGKLAEAREAFGRVLTLDVSDELKVYARDRVTELDAATKGR